MGVGQGGADVSAVRVEWSPLLPDPLKAIEHQVGHYRIFRGIYLRSTAYIRREGTVKESKMKRR